MHIILKEGVHRHAMTSPELWQSYIFNDQANVMTNFSYLPIFKWFCFVREFNSTCLGKWNIKSMLGKIIAN